jgi:hypothetical protein
MYTPTQMRTNSTQPYPYPNPAIEPGTMTHTSVSTVRDSCSFLYASFETACGKKGRGQKTNEETKQEVHARERGGLVLQVSGCTPFNQNTTKTTTMGRSLTLWVRTFVEVLQRARIGGGALMLMMGPKKKQNKKEFSNKKEEQPKLDNQNEIQPKLEHTTTNKVALGFSLLVGVGGVCLGVAVCGCGLARFFGGPQKLDVMARTKTGSNLHSAPIYFPLQRNTPSQHTSHIG